MREVVMAMCVRGGGAFHLTFSGSSLPPKPLFFWFLSQNGVFCSHFSLH